jgi:hypothetical protein
LAALCPFSSLTECEGSEDGMIHVWNAETGAALRQYSDGDLTTPVHDVAFHPHDNIIAAASFGASQPVLLYYPGPWCCLAEKALTRADEADLKVAKKEKKKKKASEPTPQR